jgi:hypothetical protein
VMSQEQILKKKSKKPMRFKEICDLQRIKSLSSSYYLLARIIINLWLKVVSESNLN